MKTLLSMLLLAGLSTAAEKNILFIIADDMGQSTGCYGNPVIQTPHLDQLAKDGILFPNAFATTASCSASRSVILSGLHNHANGQYGHAHDFHKFTSWQNLASLTLPRVLANEGYRTAHIGKYHVAPETVYHFETYLKGPERNAPAMAENVRDFINQKDERPFFLYFATADPHRGGGIDENSPQKPDLFGNKPDRQSWPGVTEVFYDPKDVIVPPFLPDTPECRAELAHYYQSCSRIDQGVGHLIEILKEAGVYEKTLIIFTSDHGMAFPGGKTTVYDPGLRVPFIVRNPYQEARGISNPAMISHVDITPTLVDFAGGLDATGRAPAKPAPLPAEPDNLPHEPEENTGNPQKLSSWHGRSWLPILGENNPEGWDEIQASHTFHEIQMYYPMRVFQDRDYKLIWNIAHPLPFPFASDLWAAATWQAQWKKGQSAPYGKRSVGLYIHRPAFELYDMKKDPDESNNLAIDPDFSEKLTEYKEKLKQFQIKTDDPWILKWEYE